MTDNQSTTGIQAAASFDVQILRGRLHMKQLQDDWLRLVSAATSASMFSSWHWVEAWLRVNPTIEPIFLVVTAAGKVVGLAPLYLQHFRLAGFLRVRMLRILGDSESAAEYQVPVITSNNAVGTAITAAVFERLATFDEWDGLWLPAQLLDVPGLSQLQQGVSAAGLGWQCREAEFSSLKLPENSAMLVRDRSKSTRQMLARVSKRYVGQEMEFHRVGPEDDVAMAYRLLQKLHGLRWQAVGQAGAFERRPLLSAFLAEFLPMAQAQGWLNFWLLYLDGSPVAAQLGFEFDRSYFLIQEGFDPEFEGVGNLLRARVMDEAVTARLRTYDFLGGYSEHKRRWGAVRHTGQDLLVTRKSLAGQLVMRSGIWPTGRFLTPQSQD